MDDPATTWDSIRLRYPGTCVRCGTRLPRGANAEYDRMGKVIRCVECPTTPGPTTDDAIDTGIAGASARREYERRKAGRQTATIGRFGNRLGRLVLALTDDPQSTRAWAQGSQGEESVAQALAGIPGVVLHDRRVARTHGNTDHIVVARGGLFVVDAKRYQGLIKIRDKGGLFRSDQRLYVGSRDCSGLADNMAWQVRAIEVALATAGIIGMHVTPVLCFIDGEWPLLSSPHVFRGVLLEGPRSLAKRVSDPLILDRETVERVARVLGAAFPPK